MAVICFCRLSSTLNDLNEERQLGKALRHNQQQWQVKITKLEEKFNEIKAVKEKEIGELKEQVRDLMFFIDAQRVSDLMLIVWNIKSKESILTIEVGLKK